jgi:predicted nucleotidyltransferase
VRAPQGSRLQLVARVVDASVEAQQTRLARNDAPFDSSDASARGIGYYLAAGAHQLAAPGGAGARSVLVALDRLPRTTAQTVLDRTVWRGKELLLGAPTASVLHAFGACRAAQHTARARADAHRLPARFVVATAGEALTPSVADARAAKEVIHKLNVTLRGQLYDGCSMDRVRVSGSRGRSTSLMGSDIDVVLFLNKARPPWNTALVDVARRLTEKLRVSVLVARCECVRLRTVFRRTN